MVAIGFERERIRPWRRPDDGVPPGLELNQDMPFQRRTWVAQRVAWALWACVVVAALAGVLGGGGPLADARAGGAVEGLAVAFERFVRREASSRIVLTLLPSRTPDRGGSRIELALTDGFGEALALERVTPRPIATRAAAQGPILVFMREEAGSGIVLDVRPRRAGRLAVSLALSDRPPVAVTLFAWP